MTIKKVCVILGSIGCTHKFCMCDPGKYWLYTQIL